MLLVHRGDINAVAQALNTETRQLCKAINRTKELSDLVTGEARPMTVREIGAETRITALRNAKGDIDAAARALDIAPKTLRAEVERDPQLRAAYREEMERIADRAQSNVAIAIEQGDLGTSKWYLDRIGAKRGFTEHKAITQRTTHMTIDSATSAQLVERLMQNLGTGSEDGSPRLEAIDAEFEVLSPEDQAAVKAELAHQAEEAEREAERNIDVRD